MADILNLVREKDLVEYSKAYNYQTAFKGSQLFPAVKVQDVKFRYKQLVEGGNIPVMAKVHSLDSEARIGDRPDFEEISIEQMLIKEKINLTERQATMLGANPSDSLLKEFVYDDAGNMISRVLTRAEVMNMELLSTGKVTVNENNVKMEVDYHLPASNKIALGNWSNPDYDIIGDLRNVKTVASGKGIVIVRAFTTSEVVGYMLANKGIQGYWANKSDVLTDKALLTWVEGQFGINFVVIDEVYKDSLKSSTVHKFFKANTITFVNTLGALGEGLYGVTPEERLLDDGKHEFSEKMLVALTIWKSTDPAGVWTKGSALYVPAIKDINSMLIGTIAVA